jgi:DNA-binding XRE family transcriptional regulator
MKNNWDRAAMKFASARYLERQEMLDVAFANGDHFLVSIESVLTQMSETRNGHAGSRVAGGSTAKSPTNWSEIRIGETGDVLEVPAGATVIEIPWDRIRASADPDFRTLLADHAKERARHIGDRIRQMRLGADLSPIELAEKVGVPPTVVADLEAGKIEPQTELIEHIALALGKRLRDFADM